MPEETEKVVDVNPDVAVSRTKAFLNRHKTKINVATATVAGATLFILGRKSKDVVEDVDVEVTLADPEPSDD